MRYSATVLLLFIALIVSGLALSYTGGKYRDAIFGVPPLKPETLLFNADDIAKVRNVILKNHSGVTAEFTFENNQWNTVNPWKDRADATFIRSLIQFSSELTVQESLPAKNITRSDLGLEQGAISVQLQDGDKNTLCDFTIGKPSALHIAREIQNKIVNEPTIFIQLNEKRLNNQVYACSSYLSDSIRILFKNDFGKFRDHHPFYFTPQLLDKISISNQEGEVVMSRPDNQSSWSITKPLELKADPQAQYDLFNDLGKLTATKIENRSEVTLPQPGAELTQEISLHFIGAEEDITLQIYPTEEGAETALATISNRPDIVFHLPIANEEGVISLNKLQLGVNDLRTKTMLQINGKQLQTIVIGSEKGSQILLQRKPQQHWENLTQTGPKAANLVALAQLIEAATVDKVEKFVTDAATDLSPYGLDAPVLKIGFVSFNKDGLALAFGKKLGSPEIYAHIIGRPNIWQVSTETLSKISIHPWEWRTTQIWNIPRVDIKHITIKKGNNAATTLRYNFFTEQWKANEGDKNLTANLNPNRANNFLKNLEVLSCISWLGPYHPQATNSLKTPDLIIKATITPVDNDGNSLSTITKTLTVGSSANKHLYYGKIQTEPADANTRKDEINYFQLDQKTIQQLSVDLFE